MFIRALSPFGAIFAKELRATARRRRNYLLRVAYLAGLLLFLFLAWSMTGAFWGPGGVAQRAEQQEMLGYFFFAFFSMFCVGAMALVGPVLTCTAINGERAAKTFHVLLMTPLSAWQIVSGKLFSRMLTAMTLIGLSLPVLALVRLLGGVELDQMFGVVCLCTVIALFGASLGLFLSILIRRAYAVIILCYLIFAFLYMIAPMITAAILVRNFPKLPWFGILASYNPFWATGFLAWGQMRMLTVHWSTCVIIHLIASAGLLVLSAFLLRAVARREGEGATGSVQAAPVVTLAPPLPLPAEGGRAEFDARSSGTARQGRTVSDWPIMWREMRRPLMTRTWQRIVAVALVSIVLVMGYLAAWGNDALREPTFHAFLGSCFYTLMLLLTCVISATSIASEKEGESWTVLLASPLSGRAIVWGKTLGVLRRLMWPTLLVVVHFLIFTLFGVLSPLDFVIALAAILAFNAIWIGTGVAISLRCKKVTVAVIANLSLPVLLYGVGSIILGLVGTVTWNNFPLRQVNWYLPYAYLFDGIDSRSAIRHVPGSDIPIPAEGFALIAIVIGVLHILAAVAILAWIAERFDAIVGRAKQLDWLAKSPPQVPAM